MSKTSVLLITADELCADALSCYGGREIRTPHLDALAAEGVQFTSAYCASPWCLPSRCSILTGLFPSRSGAYSNFRKCPLNREIPNLFRVFKENGYRTAVSGKCHFSPVPYGQTRPDRTLPYEEIRNYYKGLGIDDLFLQDGKQVSVWFYDDYAKELEEAGFLASYRAAIWNRENRKVFSFPGPDEWHPDNWTGRKAVEYIRSVPDGTPSMLWVSFSGPHYPFDPPKSYEARVDMEAVSKRPCCPDPDEWSDQSRIHYKSYHGGGGIDGCNSAPDRGCKNYSQEYWIDLKKAYYANVALIDDRIGEIIDAAKKKWGENLLILFTADHGEMLGNHGLWGKHNCAYEDVWKVPLLVRFASGNPVRSSSARVQLTDIFPTLAEEAGINLQNIRTDGRHLRDLMQTGGHSYVYAEGEGFLAVSDGNHKYVHINKPGEIHEELFDLGRDRRETVNLISDAEEADARGKLEQQAIAHLIRTVLP